MMSRILHFVKKNTVVVIILGLIVSMAFVNPSFLTTANMVNIFTQISLDGVVAFAMTFAIICGEFDLSAGSMYTLATVIFISFYSVLGFWPAILATVAIGAGFGCISGLLVSRIKINAFIVTMAMMVALRGLALLWTNAEPIRNNDDLLYNIGNGTFLGLSYLTWILFAALVIFEIILRYTKFGRNLCATGGNYEVAKLGGINVVFYKMIIFVIVGAVAALQGTLLACRLGSGTALYGSSLALSTIAAVVIGGTSMAGGTGSVVRTFFGVLLVGIMFNILTLMKVDAYWQEFVKGAFVIAVVSIDAISRLKRKGKR